MRPALLVLMLLAAALPAKAGINAWVDADGQLVISEWAASQSRPFTPHHSGGQDSRVANSARAAKSPRPAVAGKFHPLIAHAARQTGVDAELLHAVVRAESAYNPKARSRAGAVGLMQLMPGTARRFGVRDRLDPLQSLLGGASYLAWLQRHFEGDLVLMLAAYNAGEGAVRRHGRRIPPYPETQAYVRKVLAFYAG